MLLLSRMRSMLIAAALIISSLIFLRTFVPLADILNYPRGSVYLIWAAVAAIFLLLLTVCRYHVVCLWLALFYTLPPSLLASRMPWVADILGKLFPVPAGIFYRPGTVGGLIIILAIGVACLLLTRWEQICALCLERGLEKEQVDKLSLSQIPILGLFLLFGAAVFMALILLFKGVAGAAHFFISEEATPALGYLLFLAGLVTMLVLLIRYFKPDSN